MKNLEAFVNTESSRMVAEAKRGNGLLTMSESSVIALSVIMELVEPRTFQLAWNHHNPEKCMKWREAIGKEFADINKQSIWYKIKQDKIPEGRECVKCKWAFKIKRNGFFCPCLMVCGLI